MCPHDTIYHMTKRKHPKQIVLDEDVAALVEAENRQIETPANRIVNRRVRESYAQERKQEDEKPKG